MCNCGSTGSFVSNNTGNRVVHNVSTASQNIQSAYNTDQLLLWQRKLECVKLHNKYVEYNLTETAINSHLGVVISAIKNPQYMGTFESYLINIERIVNPIPDEC